MSAVETILFNKLRINHQSSYLVSTIIVEKRKTGEINAKVNEIIQRKLSIANSTGVTTIRIWDRLALSYHGKN
jgi:hypothetical protein